jgi:prepilin-type processing-associated H-X9-DG protein
MTNYLAVTGPNAAFVDASRGSFDPLIPESQISPRRCPSCGNPVPEQASVYDEPGLHCPFCGYELPRTPYPIGGSPSIGSVTDGTSNTIMLVEVINSGIPWTAPRDFDVRQASERLNDRTSGKLSISSYHPGGANVALVDGSVRWLREKIMAATLRALLTRSGGEVISSDSY